MALQALIHGSSAASIDEVGEEGTFGGIFTVGYDPLNANKGYGEHLHVVLLDESEICRHGDLTERLTREQINEIISDEIDTDAFDEYDLDADERDEAWRMLRRWVLESDEYDTIEQHFADDGDYTAFFADLLVNAQSRDVGCLGFEIQRIRGLLAKAAGFKAVDCYDENAISTLVIGGLGTKIMTLAEYELLEREGE